MLAWLAAFTAYAGLAVAFTWPLAAHLSTAFPGDPYDPALETWILWWNAHAVPLTERWWNAPMFWPLPHALALSEHLLGISVLTTPLQWLGSSPLGAYNTAVLLSYPLCALAAHALVFTLARRHDAGIVAALLCGFSPYRTSQLSHLHMLWTFFIPVCLLAAHRFARSRRPGWLAASAAAWLLQALSNGYCLLFVPVLLLCWIVWFGRGTRLALVFAWVAASLPLVPIVWSYRRVHATLGLERTLREILFFSADMTSLIAASPRMIVWHPLSRWSRQEGELFPGALALALVFVGIVVGWRRARQGGDPRTAAMRTASAVLALASIGFAAVAGSPAIAGPWRLGGIISVSSAAKPLSIAAALAALAIATSQAWAAAWQRRSPSAFYAGAAILMFILSLGPHPAVAGHRVLYRAPYAWLMALPGYSGLRVPARFGVLFIICVAVAAACTFAKLTAARSHRSRRILAGAAALVILVESWPAAAVARPPGASAAVRHADSGAAIVELPVGIVARDIAALYRSIDHRRPIVNGYSGYSPAHYVVLEIALRDEDLDALAELGRGESLVVVLDRRFQFDRWADALRAHGAQLLEVDGDAYVYRLSGRTASPLPAGERLPVASIHASVAGDQASRMLDGDWSTVWGTPGPQQGGEMLVVDLGAEKYVAALRLDFGRLAGDVPRRLSVECAGEHDEWQTCWHGSALAAAVRGALEDPLRVPMMLAVDRAGVRRLRLRENAADSDRAWSVAEMAVLGR